MIVDMIELEAVGIGELGQQLHMSENKSAVVLDRLVRESVQQLVGVDLQIQVEIEANDDSATVAVTLRVDHLEEAVHQALEEAADSVGLRHGKIAVRTVEEHHLVHSIEDGLGR